MILIPALGLAAPDAPIRGFSPEEAARQRALEQRTHAIPRPERIREHIRRISAEPHDAGSPGSKAVADYLLAALKEMGLEAWVERYEGLLPRPVHRSLEMVSPVRFRASLKEPVVDEDPDSADRNQLPVYNAYSADGDVTAPVVYVNYGLPEDYAYLKSQGIDVKGRIVLARYGASWRGVKPKMAHEHGAAACLIYSDPRDDGYFAGDVYPKGPYRPLGSAQRGSTVEMALHPGDPLSPGWASEPGSRRLPLAEARTLQRIPVLPISAEDARPLLENLGGPVAPERWRGALPLTYHLGPGPARARLALKFDWSSRPLYNVLARIPGSVFPDEWVLYGNHHDAWVNGAADPASGAAVVLETARSLAELRSQGWRPKRTIVLALWDGEEYGLLGSTEWVEKHAAELERKAVAYLNTDTVGKGGLGAAGSPVLRQFMAEVARDIPDPETGKPFWQKPAADFRMGAPGSGSDYAAFVHRTGVPVINTGTGGPGLGGVYHSIYDSFEWYSRFGDPKFTYGAAMAKVMSTALLRLAEAPVLPFEFTSMSAALEGYLQEIGKLDKEKKLRLEPVRKETANLKKAAERFEKRYRKELGKAARAAPERLAALNGLLFRSERTLTTPQGLPGRDWFKHRLYAPGLYTGYSAKTLPGIREAAEGGRWEEANREAETVAGILRALRRDIDQAADAMKGL